MRSDDRLQRIADRLLNLEGSEADRDRQRKRIRARLTPAEWARIVELMDQVLEDKRAVMDLLLPYWGPGIQCKDAVAAFKAANPYVIVREAPGRKPPIVAGYADLESARAGLEGARGQVAGEGARVYIRES